METLASRTRKNNKKGQVQLNTISYNTAINAYASICKRNKAEIILDTMFDAYIRNNKSAQPNVGILNAVFLVWSRSKAKDAQEMVETIL